MDRKNQSNQALGRTAKKTLLATTLTAASMLASLPSLGETQLRDITELELARLQRGAEAQQQIDSIDDQRLQMANQYRTSLKQNSKLEKYNLQLTKTLSSQGQDVTSLQQQIARIGDLERDIVPLMVDMLDALESFIALDLPFLPQERKQRIEKLRTLLVNGNVANSEKYRRILEAYQIENDYGRSIEAYSGRVVVNHATASQTGTFLKVGRIAYLFQTPDKNKTYRWSAPQSQWQLLDEQYNNAIDSGIKMAKEQIPSNLMFVPISAAQ